MNPADKSTQRRRAGIQGFVEAIAGHTTAASFARFAGVGVLATLVHGVALNLLVLGANLHPTLANVVAFLCAFSISYLGHYYFSFRSRQDHAAAAPKFFFTALIGLAYNILVFAIIVNLLQLHYMIAFGAVIVTLPPMTFLFSRKFVFAPGQDASASKAPTGQLRRQVITYGPAAAFFLVTAIYIVLFHFRAPYFDQWGFVRLYRLMAEGAIGVDAMLALHDVHWHVTAYMVLYGLTEITGMNHLYESLANLAFATLGFAGLAQIITRAANDDAAKGLRPLLLGLGAALWFSLDQGGNWLWGWQVAVFINTAGAVWCIALLTSTSLTAAKFAGALVATAAAIASFATGLVLLPIGFALLVFQIRAMGGKARSPVKYYLGLWAVFSIAILTLYWRLNFSADGADGRQATVVAYDISSVGVYAHFFVNFIASPIARFAIDLTAPVAAAGGFLFFWGVRRSDIDWRGLTIPAATLALVALIAYGAGAGMLTALGRAGELGASQGFSSRYISFGNFIWIGVILMTLIAAARRGALTKRVSAPVIVIAVLFVLKFGNVVSTGKNYAEVSLQQRTAIEALIAARPALDAEAIAAFTNGEQTIGEDIDFLERHSLSFFRDEE
ncbi:MAG: GtrA family protein [Alphaproteobacteria bacterium]|nr:GtrA family protein [Alphaproteobacteria bacterium]